MTEPICRSTLKLISGSPAEFRKLLLIPSAVGARPLGQVMADFQRADFKALDAGFIALATSRMPRPINRYWLERTKGASKDTDLAVMLLWLLAFAKGPLTCQVGAADQSQADELRKAALDIVRLNEWLTGAVEVQASAIIGKRNHSRADILTADAAGSHGARPHLVILNELTHIGRREFAETLLDNASKVPQGIVVVATNAGHVDTWQAEWRANAQMSDRWHFSAYTQPAPWLDPRELAEARRRNSANRYARLWLGQWVSISGTALREDDITAALTLKGPALGPERGWRYVAALDIGLSRDASALAVIGRHVGYVEKIEQPKPAPHQLTTFEALADLGLVDVRSRGESLGLCNTEYKTEKGTGRYRLAALHVWRPGETRQIVSIEEIEKTIVEIHQRFHLVSFGADTHQAAYLLERLRKQGLPAAAVDPTSPNLKAMCATSLEAFSERLVELFPDDALLADLRALRVAERSYGVRLESPRTSDGAGTRHGDAATALAIGLFCAKRFAESGATIDRPLICWPGKGAGSDDLAIAQAVAR